jgi:hypothetical protein
LARREQSIKELPQPVATFLGNEIQTASWQLASTMFLTESENNTKIRDPSLARRPQASFKPNDMNGTLSRRISHRQHPSL